MNLTLEDEIDRGLVLRESGLVAALWLSLTEGGASRCVLRVVAVTERGRRVLQGRPNEPVENMP